MTFPVGTVVSGCEILSLLDSGGMGSVHLARQRSLGRDVVVKVLHEEFIADEEFVKRSHREAQTAGGLAHPNIVAVLDSGTHEGRHYIVMEFVEGRSVANLLGEHGCLDPPLALDIVRQAAEGLHAAHEAGVIHRDVKPGNLIVGPSGQVKVVDFGIAKISGDDVTRLTETNVMLGTIQYVSPEQFDGRPLDGRSDIYSLGVTLYQMLTGRRPFDDAGAMDFIARQASQQPPLAHTRNGLVPEEVGRLADRMIRRDPAERFADCDQVVRAVSSLEQVLGYTSAGGRTELANLGIASQRRRAASLQHDWVRWAIGAAAIAASAALGLWLSQRVGGTP